MTYVIMFRDRLVNRIPMRIDILPIQIPPQLDLYTGVPAISPEDDIQPGIYEACGFNSDGTRYCTELLNMRIYNPSNYEYRLLSNYVNIYTWSNNNRRLELLQEFEADADNINPRLLTFQSIGNVCYMYMNDPHEEVIERSLNILRRIDIF